jgi:phenylpropionate dioxygenase-like ring-hydroxylating dioxygenase large terminal subunit
MSQASKDTSVVAGAGLSRSPGISYQELLDTDSKKVPDVLRLDAPRYFGSADVSKDRYISKEFHEREVEKLWKRVWQFACREEHIPNPGDYILYEIVGLSFMVIRTTDGSIKAYPNACLHRGRQLKDEDGYCSEIRCPFHAFAWTIEGDLKHVPARWDFPHVREEDFHLPEVPVGTWAGFVFINPDQNAEPLSEFLGEIVDHFADWHHEDKYVELHVAKIIQANWKITQESFCEAYHVSATHPQILPYLGDTNSQVDVWENFSRVISPAGTPSPLIRWEPSQEEMLRSMLDIRLDAANPLQIPEGQTMRAFASELARDRWRPIVGEQIDSMSDAELMDALDYTVFPNMHPWGAYNRIVYRFRPNGNDHRSSIMEVLFLAPFAGERPKPSPLRWVGENESFSSVPELATLGKVFDQDVFNMAKVQTGLETSYKRGVTMSEYQEAKVRWLHVKLDEWLR